MKVVARRGTRVSLSPRGLLFLIGLALMLIIGLLGMHTFSGDAGGHGTPVAAESSAVVATAGMDPGMAADHHDATPTACAGACMTGSGGDHMSMATVCVLALLAGFLLILPPLLLDRFGLRRVLQAPAGLSAAGLHLPSPPSLLFLSISRT